ncbi:MAG: hypothetical protein GOMPHAMPRED_000177 [Gomphillus americanus]|uniref:Ankyrin n=1 Tax=Gomphillus americanus TaxID=1940652 RepID=A0A8H3ED76_9LECA|nr:MAG: hypothetical protein GOMPHAMPRED_000177 [Gomphillus americanus]
MVEICMEYLRLEAIRGDGYIVKSSFSVYCRYYMYAHLYDSDQENTGIVAQPALDLLDGGLKGWWDAITEHMPWFTSVRDHPYRLNNQDNLLARISYLGIVSLVKCCLDDGNIKVNDCDAEGTSPLHFAAVNGHEAVVNLLISKRAKVNIKDDKGSTPLLVAIYSGSHATASSLLDNGAKASWLGTSPLSYAIGQGRYDLVKLLLDHGASPDYPPPLSGYLPLPYAIELRRYDLAKLLLKRGAKLLHNGESAMEFPPFAINKDVHWLSFLLLAIETRETKLVELLIDYGMKVNILHCVDKWDKVGIKPSGPSKLSEEYFYSHWNKCHRDWPLAHAVQYGSLEICQLLIAKGASVNPSLSWLQDDSPRGMAPLLVALRCFKFEVVKLLLTHGASFDAAILASDLKNKSRRTIAGIASIETFTLIPPGSELTIVESVALRLFLWEAGISFGNSTSVMALSNQLKELLENKHIRGPKPTDIIPDKVLLLQAIGARAFDLAKVLALCGGDIAQLSKSKLNILLIIAAFSRDLQLLDQTLDAGASRDAKCPVTGRTALSITVAYGLDDMHKGCQIADEWQIVSHDMARALLLRGAGQEIPDKDDLKPADWAKKFKNPWYRKLFAEFEMASKPNNQDEPVQTSGQFTKPIDKASKPQTKNVVARIFRRNKP